MQQDKEVIIEILNKFQWHYRRFDVCRMSFSDLLKIFNNNQSNILLKTCFLSIKDIEILDSQIPSKDLLINPYQFSLYSKRFVRVNPSLWDSFKNMSRELTKYNGRKAKIVSGYRSPAYQSMLYLKEIYVHKFNIEATKKIIKLPGQSQHQDYENLAIDIRDTKSRQMLSNSSYDWLMQNSEKYKFINTYPNAKNKDGIIYEPWHWHFIS